MQPQPPYSTLLPCSPRPRQVCIEELKRPAKEAGVKSLPHAVVFDPTRGKLVGIDVPPSKLKNLKVNLMVSRVSCCL